MQGARIQEHLPGGNVEDSLIIARSILEKHLLAELKKPIQPNLDRIDLSKNQRRKLKRYGK